MAPRKKAKKSRLPKSKPRGRGQKPYRDGLARTGANFQPLTPLTTLERAASVFPDHPAIIHGRQRFTYRQFYDRSRRLASALKTLGVRKGDTVAAMLANTPPMLEAHYGVPMTGAVLNALNTRLDARAIAYMLDHGGARVLLTDREFAPTIQAALALVKKKPLVIDYDDPEFPQTGAKGCEPLGEDYERFIAKGDPAFGWKLPADEWDAISLNYTSGTTGDPVGLTAARG